MVSWVVTPSSLRYDGYQYLRIKAVKTSLGSGAEFLRPDEKRAQSKLPATQAQKLGYAYYS